MLVDEFGHKANTGELIGNIVFYGASTRNQRAVDELNISDRVLCFVDRDKAKAGQKLGDYSIEPVEYLSQRDDIIVISVLVEHMTDVSVLLRTYGHKCLFYLSEQFNIEKVVRINWEILLNPAPYKYIHFFPYEKFLKPFYDMVENEMNISEHLFIVNCCYNDKYGVSDYVERKNAAYRNILTFDDIHGISHIKEKSINCNMIYDDKKIHEIFSSSQKIFLHSVFFGGLMQQYLSHWADMYGNKMNWICWGGDSYYDGDNWVVQNILKKVKTAYATQSRIDLIWKSYSIKAKYVEGCSYCYIPRNCPNTCHKGKGSKAILLGHSAADYGNHIMGLELLKKWKDEDIKIYCPLSYGDPAYRDTVIDKGREMFGYKFVPMIDFMEMEQYYEFLNGIDAALFPMTRMAAGTTLLYLSSRGKKIYLSQEMIKAFDCLNMQLYDIELIREQSFEEFFRTDNYIGCLDNNDLVVSAWRRILDDR